MSHHVYQTKAIIVGNWPTGEADCLTLIFTETLGILSARSRGMRSLSSKLRFGLQDLSISDVALIKGRNQWRITNAILESSLSYELKNSPEKLVLISRLLDFAKKVVAYEQEDKYLFKLMRDVSLFLKESELSSQELLNLECIVVFNILCHLGFMPLSSNLEKFSLKNTGLTVDLLDDFSNVRRSTVKDINEAIKAGDL
ncbi:MAG: hypothetical protein A3E94_01410 [Candidatus Zambryskibacteria bacterium RIFCSPHIGHO2_12_FULL_44_12b]|nr:MAG: hypothetical protein A3E94_01410 [Candidatus Zambryskibacteria bacterium RIFCSPHIGHO2_12_FULL_44_12b]